MEGFKIIECCSCGIQFGLTVQRVENLKSTHKTFYCPSGHTQWYSLKNEEEKLRDQLRAREADLVAKQREIDSLKICKPKKNTKRS